MNRLPTTLYHYCSIDSFFHIVKPKAIWLSNSSQMNDSYENIWIEKYFDLIKDNFKDSKYDTLLERAMGIYKLSSNPPFIFCLSGSKDLLSQWRAYSNDGQGVSIGFKTKKLNFSNHIPFADSNQAINTLGINKVEYYTQKQKKRVLSLCEKIRKLFDISADNKKDNLSIILGVSLINWALEFKNYNFKEEKEWRIIHTPSAFYTYKEPHEKLSDLQFRLSQNRIITYFSYHFNEEFNSKLIQEIIVGPKCKMNTKEIEHFLEHNDLSGTKVILSKSTYR